ncbi:hypothetical protein BH20VER1_BH20VER1_08840 [soil metagenome]
MPGPGVTGGGLEGFSRSSTVVVVVPPATANGTVRMVYEPETASTTITSGFEEEAAALISAVPGGVPERR